MKESAQVYFKNNFIKYVGLANLILLLTIGANGLFWKQKTDDNIEALQKNAVMKTDADWIILNKHVDDVGVHMPLSKKIETFVPRAEHDVELDALKERVDRIEDHKKTK